MFNVIITVFAVSIILQQATTPAQATMSSYSMTTEIALTIDNAKNLIEEIDNRFSEVFISPAHKNDSTVVIEALKMLNTILDSVLLSVRIGASSIDDFILKFFTKSGGPRMLRQKPSLSLYRDIFEWDNSQINYFKNLHEHAIEQIKKLQRIIPTLQKIN